jgi:hypothetical protein
MLNIMFKNPLHFVFLLILISYAYPRLGYPYTCPEERDQFCTMEYVGVCGWSENGSFRMSSATKCTACSMNEVNYVTLGECPEEVFISTSSQYPYTCPKKRAEFCTMEYVGVCGWSSDGLTKVNSGNKCTACGSSNINYVTLGECPENL